MKGEQYGRLTVVGVVPGKPRLWTCVCSCGEQRVYAAKALERGRVVSCGCYRREKSRRHGCSGATPEYFAWQAMTARCSNPRHPSYKHYGGRGIGVCARWSEFEAFHADMGPRPSPRHSIDRIDNSKGYEPGNCRWATQTTQIRNRRNTVRLTVHGETLPAAEWCARTGITLEAIYGRLRSGWSHEDAALKPMSGPRAGKTRTRTVAA